MPFLRRLLLVASLLTPLGSPRLAASGLPPEGCVQLLRAARIAATEGNDAQAMEAYRRAIRDYPKEIVPVEAFATFLRQRGSAEEELQALRVLLRERLLDPEAVLPPGSMRKIVEDPATIGEELAIVRQAVESRLARSADDTDLLDALALLQERIEDFSGARVTLERLRKIKPGSEMTWRCIHLDRKLGRWDELIGLLRAEKQKGSGSGDALINLTLLNALADAGRYEEIPTEAAPLLAESSLRKQVADTFLLPAAWRHRDAGRDAEAEKLFRLVLEINPENAEARTAVLHLYGTVAEREAQTTALADRWSKEGDPVALLTEGTTRLVSGDATSAFELLTRAASGLPKSEVAAYNLGLAAAKLKRWEDAERAMRRAAEIKAGFAEAHLQLGIALQKLGRPFDAISELRRALSLRKDLRDAHVALFDCYQAIGDATAAEKERALAGPDK